MALHRGDPVCDFTTHVHNGPLVRLADCRRRLLVIRVVGWIAFFIETSVLVACWYFVLIRHGHWINYLWSLAAVLAWFNVLPYCFGRWMTKVSARVHSTGDRWRIGKYSEAELRSVVQEATAGLPPETRRLHVCIADVRGVAAWTWLNAFWPRANLSKTIVLTSGSLYYLDRQELIAVILHEVAHHLPENRMGALGGWLLADMTFHAVSFWAYYLTYSSHVAALTFLLLRWTVVGVASATVGNAARNIEHLCDLFAAEQGGSTPMINALLKLGEDEELSEVVLVWVAREMIHDPHLAIDDLMLALADARPYGRIFHENLFRHAGEVVKNLQTGRKPAKPGRRRKENQELKEFVEDRRSRQARRIRWRRFDADGDGALTDEEIAHLCEAVLANPKHVLVTSREESEATTHPPCRDRILLLHQVYPSRCATSVASSPSGIE